VAVRARQRRDREYSLHVQQLTYLGPSELAWREAPAARLDSDRAALVRPIAVATCDLDALILAGRSPFRPPFALGHECVAEVTDVGEDVSSIKPGQRVSVPFQISCGECAACRRGRTGNCHTEGPFATYGFGPAVQRWGGFLSDLVLVPYADHMLVAVPDVLVPAAVASASDNISDAWRSVGPPLEREPGAPVLVVGGAGPGSIGLYAVAIAIALGSELVTYADSDDARLTLAGSLGAEVLRAPWPERLGPVPITVDANGTEEGIALALRSTAPDGICTSSAIYFGEPPSLPLLEMYTKIVTFKTGRAHVRPAMPSVLGLAERGVLHPELITTEVVGWPDAVDALVRRDWTKLVLTRD
jgi:threonine dehydrogenase-like Zn-dependent dehydrogenase